MIVSKSHNFKKLCEFFKLFRVSFFHHVTIVANLRRRGAARRFWSQKFGNKNAIKTKLQNTHPKNWPHLCSNGAVPAVFGPSAALFTKKGRQL